MCPGSGMPRLESECLRGLRRELKGSGTVSVYSRGRGQAEDRV